MTMLRVANIIEDGRLAGPQIRIEAVASRLREYEVETVVIYPIAESQEFKERLNSSHVRNIRLPLHRLTKGKIALIKYFTFFPYELILLYRTLKKEKIEIVHCSGGAWQFKGVLAGRAAGVKVIWHLNDTLMPTAIRILFQMLSSFAADGYIVAGEKVKSYYFGKSQVRKPCYIIQAPVDTKYYDPSIATENKSLAENQAIKVITIANVNPVKGLEDYLEMARILNSKHDNIFFAIIGPIYDSQRKYSIKLKSIAEEYALNNLIFYGASSDIRGILKSAAIYVCTSIAEASPTSVWEAMAMEKAIVSTDVGDVSKYIRDGISGFVVPIHDPLKLAERVSSLMNNNALRKACGINARVAAQEYFDINICVQEHLKIYQHVLVRK